MGKNGLKCIKKSKNGALNPNLRHHLPKLEALTAQIVQIRIANLRGSAPEDAKKHRGSEPSFSPSLSQDLRQSHRKLFWFAKQTRAGSSRKARLRKTKRRCEASLFCFWSGLRGSNPPPRPWQGRALPNELNPRSFYLICRAFAFFSFVKESGDPKGTRTPDL